MTPYGITRPQWVNTLQNVKSCIIGTGPPLAQVMAYCLFGTKLSTEPMLTYSQMDHQEQTSVIFDWSKTLLSRKCLWKSLQNGSHFIQVSMCQHTEVSTKWQPFYSGLHMSTHWGFHKMAAILFRSPCVNTLRFPQNGSHFIQVSMCQHTEVSTKWQPFYSGLHVSTHWGFHKMAAILFRSPCVNTLRFPQNGGHFIQVSMCQHTEVSTKWWPFCRYFICIFLNGKDWIVIKISLMFVPEGQIDESTLDQVMAWHLSGTKSLPEPILNRVHNAACHHNVLTPKQLETQVCVLSTVATDSLMLNHQAIRINSADKIL